MALPTASDNAFPSVLITEGTEPSAPAAGKQRLYIDSTTHKLKRTDSSGTDVTIEGGAVASDAIWDTKGDLAVATAADTASKLAVGSNGQVLTADSAQTTGVKWATPSAGGAVDWNQDINNTGSTFTGWTGDTGTWASNGTIIQQTDGGGAQKYAHYNTKLPIGLPFIYECEVRIVSGTGVAGLLMGYDGAGSSGGLAALISDNGNKVSIEAPSSVAEVVAYSTTIATNTYYKIRVIGGSQFYAFYLDGTLLTNYAPATHAGSGLQHYVGLKCWTAVADFRNIKLWTLATGLPA